MVDRLISGAKVFDGHKFLNHRHVGFKDGLIAYVGSEKVPSKTQTDAAGYLLTPGFIDTHSHADYHCTHRHNDGFSALSQGVSTLIIGNCGMSATPGISPHAILMPGNNDKNVPPEIQPRRLEGNLALNVSDLMGHNTLRMHVMGKSGTPSVRQVEKMSGILDGFLAQGGLGMSVGLNYPEAQGSTETELLALCRVLAKYGCPLTCHIRDQGAGLIGAAEEVLRLGQKSDCKVLISHLRPSLERNEYLLDNVLNRIEQNENFKLDLYPYAAGFSNLAWLFQHLFKRLPDKSELIDPQSVEDRSLEVCLGGLEDLHILNHRNSPYVGLTIAAVASNYGERPGKIAQDVYFEDPDCLCIYDNESTSRAVERALRHPDCFIGSDGYLFSSGEHPLCHPRNFAAFTGFMVRFVQNGKVSLENALHRMTQAPAEYFNLKGLGVIREGAHANVNLFRLKDLREQADFEHPWKPSLGMHEVMIAGQTVYGKGKIISKNRLGHRIPPSSLFD